VILSVSFLSVVLAAKRIANIVKDAAETPVDESLLVEASEKELAEVFAGLRADIEEAAAAGDYDAACAASPIAPVLDRFFVEVLVMAEDPNVRRNRIALLQAIGRAVSRTAKLTEVVVDKAEARAKAG
jgi:glycyl-tRNA synthetase beta chain